MIKSTLINFKKYSFLIQQLVTRDFKVKYKRSVLGIVWSLLYPVLMMAVMAVVFSQMFKFKVEGINYLVYLMTGLIMFNYFSEATSSAMISVVSNFSLINKVYIPKYIFPISKCLFVLINFVLTLIPWLGIILLSNVGLGQYPCHFNIYYLILPYVFICLFLFSMGMGLLLSCISVFLRDIIYIYGIIITIWNYLTPVFYSVEILPKDLQVIMGFNPLYRILDAARQIVLYGQSPSLLNLGIIGLIGLGSLIIGGLVFKKNQNKFIYYI